jgi:ParB family chromosome partitioning protein
MRSCLKWRRRSAVKAGNGSKLLSTCRYGCERGKRRITGTTIPLTDEEQARLDALVEEYDAIGEQYRDGCDLPDEVDARLTEIDAEMTPLTSRPVVFEPDEQARAGVFVSLTHDGRLRIDRGYVRPEDELVAEGPICLLVLKLHRYPARRSP